MRMPKTAAGSAGSGAAAPGAAAARAKSNGAAQARADHASAHRASASHNGAGHGGGSHGGGSHTSASHANASNSRGSASHDNAGQGSAGQGGTSQGSASDGSASQGSASDANASDGNDGQVSAGHGSAGHGSAAHGSGNGAAPRPGAAGSSEAGLDTSAGAQAAAGQQHSRRPLALLRLHWLAALLLAGGLALRLLVQFSFSPAILYIDSVKYLYGAWPQADPLGYDVPLKLILLVGNLGTVEAVQHLLGLAMAVTLYLVLLRRGVPRWLAALAMGPVLLDAYQLQMEATIMPDVWFEAVIVAGLAILLWRPRTTLRVCLLAGFVLGLAATVRQVGEILIVPALLFVLAGAGGWRQALTKSAALIVAFAVPIVAYCSGSYVITGHFFLSRNGQQATYGRMAGLADCATLKLPAYERPLCPTPAQQALGADWLDHAANSPLRQYVPPANLVRSKVIANFNHRVVLQQPLRVVGRITSDAAKLFAVDRVTSPGDTPISRWQFHTTYQTFAPTIMTDKQGTIIFGLKLAVAGGPTIYRKLDASYGGNSHVWVPGAKFLRRYQVYGGYAPGPLLLLAFLAGLAGALTIFRRRRSEAQRQLALGAVLLWTTGVAVLLISDLFEFTWRYQMPALVTLPAAGAIGIAAVLRYVRRRKTGHGADSVGREQRVAARAG
jgi:hypothetical protein